MPPAVTVKRPRPILRRPSRASTSYASPRPENACPPTNRTDHTHRMSIKQVRLNLCNMPFWPGSYSFSSSSSAVVSSYHESEQKTRPARCPAEMLNKPFVDAPRETGHARAGPSAQPNNVPYFERRPPPNQTSGPNAVAIPAPRSAVAPGRAPPVSPDGVVENDAAAPPTRRSSVQSVQLPPPPARIINKLQIRPHSIRRQSLPRHRVFPKPPHPAWEPPPPPSVPSEKKHSGPDTQLDSLHIKSHPNPEQRILRIVSELHRPYGRAKPGADPVDVHRAVPPTSRLKFHEIRKQDPVQ